MKANAPENYPVQFRDKIDEYLWKEHHILGGCCSSIEVMKYAVAREVAEKITEAFIEKACDFIAENMTCNGYTLQTKAKFIRGFRNYMKGD